MPLDRKLKHGIYFWGSRSECCSLEPPRVFRSLLETITKYADDVGIGIGIIERCILLRIHRYLYFCSKTYRLLGCDLNVDGDVEDYPGAGWQID